MSEPPVLSEDGLGERPRALISWRSLERLVYYLLSLVWAVVPARIPRIVGAGGNVNWHNIVMRRIAADEPEPADYTLSTIGATIRFYCTSYPPTEGGRGRWWMFAGLLGIAIGIGLGQVV
ncbi:hypothetical protein BC628DRAFT_621774 [Trametes gibbosa]|nr:hypothetical protein BC628DRAFT_621774 [Trametes gibbosa]